MKFFEKNPWIKPLAKIVFVVQVIVTNIVNIIYCITWKPGYDHIKSLIYKKGGSEEYSFLNSIQDINRITHKLSLLLLVASLILLIKKRRYIWFSIAGILTFIGLLYQLYIFGYL